MLSGMRPTVLDRRRSSRPHAAQRLTTSNNNEKKPVRYILLLITLLAAPLHAEPPAPAMLESGAEPAISYARGPLGQSPAIVLAEADWEELGHGSPNFGYQDSDAFWFKFRLGAPRQEATRRIVEIRYPQLDHVTFRLYQDGRLVKTYITGDRVPFKQRPVAHPHYLFPVLLEPDHDYQVLLEVRTNGTVQVPVRVWDTLDLFDSVALGDQAHALYFGILIVIIFFNLFVYLTLRERAYLYYVFCTAGYLFLMATIRGVTYPLLWPENPWLQNQAMLVSVPLATFFSALFVRSFLRLPESNPVMDRVVQASLWISALAFAASFVLDYNTSMRLSVALAIPICLMLLLIGPLEWWRGNQAARLYALAWALLTLGCTLAALNKHGWLPTNPITEYGIQLGSAFEAILLTIALAQRLFREREDKVEAQSARLREHAERRLAELKLMDQALHHSTTGLPNRACYEMLFKDLLQSQNTPRYAVGVIQLLDYQTVHKTLGHNNTDRVIAEVARRFNHAVSALPGIQRIEQTESDRFYLAALENSAFAFILDAGVAEQEKTTLSRGLARLNEPVSYMGMELSLAPATGLAVFPDHGKDISNLIRQAYIAQESSSGTDLAYYLSNQDAYNASRLTMAAELKKALRDNELALYFQPKLALGSQLIVGLEALIRWPRRARDVTPDVLIAVAEQTGLIRPLTRWVLTEALAARQELRRDGFDLDISVNISPNNLREPDFPAFVQNLMKSNPGHLGHVVLELTETSMMLDPANSLKVLRALDNAGIPISIDDFGSGYSSLSYIKRLPAREIKVDKSLITELCDQPDDRVIVQTTIAMCHNLGYKVVAEGVEDIDTQILLESMGCDEIQGFVLTRALPLDAITAWLKNWHRLDRAGLG